MKKLFRRAVLAACVFGCMTCAAFAMDADVTVTDSGASLTPAGGSAITSEAAATVTKPTSYKLSYNDASVKAGDQYLVLMVAASDIASDDPSYTITSDSLLYIDQAASTDGNITFETVYPTSVTDAVILLSGGAFEQPKVIAKVDAKGILGDVDDNGKVNVADAQTILRYSVKLKTFTDEQKDLADVDGNGKTNISDAQTVLRYAVKLITKFPRES